MARRRPSTTNGKNNSPRRMSKANSFRHNKKRASAVEQTQSLNRSLSVLNHDHNDTTNYNSTLLHQQSFSHSEAADAELLFATNNNNNNRQRSLLSTQNSQSSLNSRSPHRRKQPVLSRQHSKSGRRPSMNMTANNNNNYVHKGIQHRAQMATTGTTMVGPGRALEMRSRV